MKQHADEIFASSELHTETVDQHVTLPIRAVLLRHFEEEIKMTARVHLLVAGPYFRTELQFRLTW